MVSIPLSCDTKEFIRDTRHHQDIASNETYQSTPRTSQGKPEDNTETYQSITIAHHETYQSQPEDTSRIPEPAKAGHETHQSIPNDTLRAVLSDFICGLNMIVPKTN